MDSHSPTPQPSILQQACAVLSILESLAFAGILIPGLIYREVCFTFTSVLFLPWPVILAVQQYRGTFRRQTSAAAWACGLSSLPLSFLSIALRVGIASPGRDWQFLLWCVLLFAIQSVVVFANWKWLQTLSAAAREGWSPTTTKTITVAELMVLVAGIAVVMAVGLPLAKPLQGISVSASSTPFSLPEGAHDVTYEYASFHDRYECTVDEASFLAWFERRKEGEHLKSIQQGINVQTFVGNSFALKNLVVTDGWHYSWQEEDQGVYITFDRQTKRLYYHSHSR